MIKKIKTNRTIMIGNETFDIKGIIDMQDLKGLKFDRLESCYARPSQAKTSIYYNWFNTIANNSNILSFGVGSYNCNIFTINAIIELHNKKYYLHITPTRNECYEVIGMCE